MCFLFTMSDNADAEHSPGRPNVARQGARRNLFVFSRYRTRSHVRRPPSGVSIGGARRDRTDDLMLAKHALSQLSYGPVGGRRTENRGRIRRFRFLFSVLRIPNLVGLGGLEPPTSRLSSARSNQLSYKPLAEDGGQTTENGSQSVFRHPSSDVR